MGVHLFLGDSITDAGHLFEPENLGEGYVRRIAEKLGPDEQVVNWGQDGFTSNGVLRMIRRRGIPEGLSTVSLLIGVNDLPVAYENRCGWIPDVYEENLRAILDRICFADGTETILMEPFLFTPPDEYKNWMPLLEQEREVLRKLAAEYGTQYLLLQQRLDEARMEYGYERITPDGIHLRDKGCFAAAEAWIEMRGKI